MVNKRHQRKGNFLTIVNKLIVTFSTLLLLGGCASSNLSFKDSRVNVQVDQSFVQVQSTIIRQKRENFSILFLNQKLLRLDDGSIAVYEEAYTDSLYEFEPTTTRSIAIIFDAKQVIRVYQKSLLFAYQVILKDNRILNVLVSQNIDQELKMIYGMSTSKLNEILKKLDNNALKAPYMNVINLKSIPNPILSNWSIWKINFVPLIVPIRRFGLY